MAGIFTKIKDGFVWLGHELAGAATWVPKLVKLTDDAEADAQTLLPEIATLIDDAGAVGTAVVKDSGSSLQAAVTLADAIAVAVVNKGVNFADDEAVVAATKAFVANLANSSNFKDVVSAVQALVISYDAVGATVKTALAQFEADAKAV